MVRSSRRIAAATARKPLARTLHARANFRAGACNPRMCDLQTAVAANARFDRIAVQPLWNAAQRCVRMDVSPAHRLTNGTLAYSIRAPIYWRARVECATVHFANRCGNKRSI
eukprot:3084720-Lingulodinium_polyedra.AAC.1